MRSRGRRRRRKPDDRGAVTVETAATVATYAVLLTLMVCVLLAAADQVRCVDAAREAARLTARGEQEQAVTAAARIAPANARITIKTEDEHIEVDIHASPAKGLLPGIELHAEAFAVREPGETE